MSGYFRFPSIHNDNAVFVSEDDLWIVNIKNPIARRLTSNYGNVSSPLISPDGKTLAFIGQEDGNTEIFTMPLKGGQSKRITFEAGIISNISAWKDDNIYYSSSLASAFGRTFDLRVVSSKGGESKDLSYGMIKHISFNKDNIVLGKNTADPARWKRYKGGTAGKLLINTTDKQTFKYLLDLNGNISSPMYIENRIYFISDHEGIANIYSCLKTGKSIKKHTNHKNYFVRNASSDNKNIIYQCGGKIFIYNLDTKTTKCLDIIYHSSKTQISRKYVSADKYIERLSTDNKSSYLNIIARGKSFTMGNWNGPVYQQGASHGIRYNHSCNLVDNNKILLTSDKNNTDNLEIHSVFNTRMIKRLKSTFGRVTSIKRSPKKDLFTLINHKHELSILDTSKDKILKIDRSKHSNLSCNWSPCGKYLAYSCSTDYKCNIIKIYDLKNKKSYTVTDGVSNDFSPIFDPSGKYLAFLSNRTFNPIYDSIQFDLGFPKAEKPYIIILSKDTKSPFIKNPIEKEKNKKKKDDKKDKKKDVDTVIDFKNINNRIVGIPVNESLLDNAIGFYNNKLFYLSWPISARNYDEDWYEPRKGTLKFYNLETLEEKLYSGAVTHFKIENDKMILINGSQIRITNPDVIPSKDILQNTKFNKESGLINLNRIQISINLTEEWKQMYSEAWRLQRDHFWVSNMSHINWKKVYDRYYKLIDNLGSRSEFSDLVWEMQGELGTSHCYEMGGDYRPSRKYYDGLLGADLSFDNKTKSYKIDNIYKGDTWKHPQSPLITPGLNVSEGDYITSINGIKLSKKVTPGHTLVNKPNNEIEVSIIDKKNMKSRKAVVKTISNDKSLKYRDWVEYNRDYVHKKSKGKIGYIHIPDMGVPGYSEFHRYFLTEISYDGLIIDVRYNGGGHVSQLLLSKLARKRIGFDITRWMGKDPYPMESPAGPMIAITNEFAGSDGDIFSHSWKLMKLGKLIGKRTWGGVIGIWPRNSLVDGTLTSQPEFSFWFKDVGWDVENYGTDVDIEIDNMPQDNLKSIDKQLDKGIELVLKDLKKKGSVLIPDFSNKPNLKLP